MNKVNIFFYCSCAILLFTIINLSVGPVISGKAPFDGTANCAERSDNYDNAKKNPLCDDDCLKYDYEWYLNRCNNEKGMYNMEYTSFIFDIVIGFVCGLIGLLHLFDLKKDFVSNTGLIGLICGIIGFVLTFVYVIFNGIVFTGQYSDVYERDGDGVFAEAQNDGSFKCLYFDDSGDSFAGKAKFSDLNKKQYNYKHKFYDGVATTCKDNTGNWIEFCSDHEKITTTDYSSLPTGTCAKLYAEKIDSITNKDIFDRFLTALILSLVVCLANIGLALFGFLLFRTPSDF